MKPEIADKLGDADDFYSLTKAVLAMCEPYGQVHAFRLVHNKGAARVACLIEMESPRQQSVLAKELGVRQLNGAACLDIPVRKDFGTPIKVAVLQPHSSYEASAAAS